MNYQKELSKVVPVFNYRNCLIEKIIGGYRWNNKNYKSLTEIDDAIDSSLKSLGKSITVENKGTINCQNVSINCQNEVK